MLLAALLCYAGFTALCLSMNRHAAELLNRSVAPGGGRSLKLCGGLLLAVSCWAAVAADGWGFGLVHWFAVLMASALLLVFLMPFSPRWVLWLAAVSVTLSPFAVWAQLTV